LGASICRTASRYVSLTQRIESLCAAKPIEALLGWISVRGQRNRGLESNASNAAFDKLNFGLTAIYRGLE